MALIGAAEAAPLQTGC